MNEQVELHSLSIEHRLGDLPEKTENSLHTSVF